MKLNISTLATGFHELDFEEQPADLEIEDQKMFPNPVLSHVVVDKSDTHIYIKVTVRSIAHFLCDRCLREFDQDLSGDLQLYFEVVPIGSHGQLVEGVEDSLDNSVRIYHPNNKVIDLTQDILATLVLMIPMKVLCSEDCKGLCPGCGSDLSVDPCVCVIEKIDPQWEDLKRILNKASPKK